MILMAIQKQKFLNLKIIKIYNFKVCFSFTYLQTIYMIFNIYYLHLSIEIYRFI